MTTFAFESGVTVTLKRAENQFALRHLKAEGDRVRRLVELGKEIPPELESISERAFAYFAGWCVEDDPPESALEELACLGLDNAKSPKVLRARWLRYTVLSSEDEASRFITACMKVNRG